MGSNCSFLLVHTKIHLLPFDPCYCSDEMAGMAFNAQMALMDDMAIHRALAAVRRGRYPLLSCLSNLCSSPFSAI